MLTIVAFVVALGLLIAVHEYGHYRVAVACGVKVLRFSVGFGKPLLRWQPKGSPTPSLSLALFPLGGYVRMLDEREAPVPEHERHLAFNTQPLALARCHRRRRAGGQPAAGSVAVFHRQLDAVCKSPKRVLAPARCRARWRKAAGLQWRRAGARCALGRRRTGRQCVRLKTCAGC
jgi:hypothetical protein